MKRFLKGPRNFQEVRTKLQQHKTALLSASLVYIGFFPFAPGTLASLVTAGVYYAFFTGLPLYVHVSVGIGTFILGVWSADICQKGVESEDPSFVVMDEVAGQWIACLGFTGLPQIVAAFFFFRMFDVLKPFGIRQVEHMRGGWGIMLDDVLAGVYAWICAFFVFHFI